MVKHFIIMASSYSLGKRIVLDYFDENNLDTDFIHQNIHYILKKCGEDVPISTHFIQTDGLGWDKVTTLDKFFENTLLIETKEEFVKILLKDRNLKGIDIAKYILTKVPCTHLKLEKLVYMCYADYLCQEKEKLFDDKIFAYRLGPVIETVYKKYKRSGLDFLDVEDDTLTYDEQKKKMPIRSRILSSSNGVKKLVSIDETLKKYSEYSASTLVSFTHRNYTPWTMSKYSSQVNEEISDDLIIKYHKYEEI